MPIHKKLLPHLNASTHGYAHDLKDRFENGLITQAEAKAELSKRKDEQEIRQILERLKGEDKH